MSDNIPEVNAQRRRRSSNKPTHQAERPVRRDAPPRPSSSGGGIGMKPPSSSGSGFSGMPPSGGSSFGSGSPLGGLGGGLGSIFGSGAGTPLRRRGGCGGIVGLILLLIILFLVFRSCQGGGSLLPSIESSDPYQPAQDTGYAAAVSHSHRWPTAVP